MRTLQVLLVTIIVTLSFTSVNAQNKVLYQSPDGQILCREIPEKVIIVLPGIPLPPSKLDNEFYKLEGDGVIIEQQTPEVVSYRWLAFVADVCHPYKEWVVKINIIVNYRRVTPPPVTGITWWIVAPIVGIVFMLIGYWLRKRKTYWLRIAMVVAMASAIVLNVASILAVVIDRALSIPYILSIAAFSVSFAPFIKPKFITKIYVIVYIVAMIVYIIHMYFVF